MLLCKLGRSVLHNCIVHPLLPWADLCDWLGLRRVAAALDQLHDLTAPR